jgi:hypothetical protein
MRAIVGVNLDASVRFPFSVKQSGKHGRHCRRSGGSDELCGEIIGHIWYHAEIVAVTGTIERNLNGPGVIVVHPPTGTG